MNSFVSSVNDKNGGHSWIPNLVIFLLGIELLVTISLIVFFDNSGSASNLFYLASLGFLMCWTIYFSWHSLVKENGFEMTAFMSMAIIITAEGVFFALTHSLPSLLAYLSIGFYVLSLFAYIISCYCCYMHYGKTHLSELDDTMHYQMYGAVKDYDMFISVIKLIFVLYTIVASTFVFYMIERSDALMYVGLGVSAGSYLVMVAHSLFGVYSVSRESRRGMIGYIVASPLLQVLLGGMIFEIYKAPGGHIYFVLLDQAVVIFVINLMLSAGNIYLGVRNLKKFGTGIKSIIRQTNDDLFKAAFI